MRSYISLPLCLLPRYIGSRCNTSVIRENSCNARDRSWVHAINSRAITRFGVHSGAIVGIFPIYWCTSLRHWAYPGSLKRLSRCQWNRRRAGIRASCIKLHSHGAFGILTLTWQHRQTRQMNWEISLSLTLLPGKETLEVVTFEFCSKTLSNLYQTLQV